VNKHFLSRLIFFIAVLVVLPLQGQQNVSYPKEFGNAYDAAKTFLLDNQWMLHEIESKNLCPALCLSIVFPEIIRYNIIIDAIQISALKMLYKQFGSDYADFSIGRFQMKPSFAVQLEMDWLKMKKPPFLMQFDTSDTPLARHKRLERLESVKGQLDYLCMFVSICSSKFSRELKKMSPNSSMDSKVRFLATAYNYGYQSASSSIIQNMNIKQFHTDIVANPFTTYYSYADISANFYKSYSQIIQQEIR
jgi:hypothetical protein